MRILLLGVTGSVGLQLIRSCLDKYTQSTLILYIRNPAKIPPELAQHRSVIILEGQLDNTELLTKALEGVHIVLSALGPSVQKGPFHPSGTPIAKAYEGLLHLMRAADVKRIILLGTTSISDSNDTFDWRFKSMVTTVQLLARNAYKEFVAIGELFKTHGSDLDYTVARVPVLNSDKSTEYQVGYVGNSKMSVVLPVAAYAAFVISEIDSRQWVQKMPLVTSK